MIEQFTIYPRAGTVFDVESLRARLRALPTAVALPALTYFVKGEKRVRDDWFALCSSPARARRVLDTALAGRGLDEFYGTIAIVDVKPDWIWVELLASPGVIEQVRDLLLPILRRGDCRIVADTGDVTDEYGHAPERIFDYR